MLLYVGSRNTARRLCNGKRLCSECTVEPVYNDIGLYDTSPITSDILWCQLIRHC
jgi:hypothetical protein